MHDERRDRSSPPAPAATLEVAVFAGLAEAVGARSLAVPWTGGCVGDLRAAFTARAPAALALVARSVVVVDGRHAADDEPADALLACPPGRN